jgi:hypothetical protein
MVRVIPLDVAWLASMYTFNIDRQTVGNHGFRPLFRGLRRPLANAAARARGAMLPQSHILYIMGSRAPVGVG